MKPTPAQRRVLEALRDGAVIRVVSGGQSASLYIRYFLSPSMKTVPHPVFRVLYNANCLINTASGYNYPNYTITDAGRAAITDSRDTEAQQ